MSEGDSEANDPVLHKGGVRFFLRWIAAVLRAKKIFISLLTDRCYSGNITAS